MTVLQLQLLLPLLLLPLLLSIARSADGTLGDGESELHSHPSPLGATSIDGPTCPHARNLQFAQLRHSPIRLDEGTATARALDNIFVGTLLNSSDASAIRLITSYEEGALGDVLPGKSVKERMGKGPGNGNEHDAGVRARRLWNVVQIRAARNLVIALGVTARAPTRNSTLISRAWRVHLYTRMRVYASCYI